MKAKSASQNVKTPTKAVSALAAWSPDALPKRAVKSAFTATGELIGKGVKSPNPKAKKGGIKTKQLSWRGVS